MTGRDLYGLFGEHVLARPGHAAVVDRAGTVSYADLDSRVRRLAATMAGPGAGVASGDIVGVQVPNGRNAVVAELAVAAVGAVALPFPASTGCRAAAGLLASTGAGALLAGGRSIVTQLATVRDRLPRLRTVLDLGALPLAGASCWRPAAVDPESPARIVVSAGDPTGPRLVAYSHNAMADDAGGHLRCVPARDGAVRDLVLVPLASAFGAFGSAVTIARAGATLLLLGAFDPAAALRMITSSAPTHVFGTPDMLRRLADRPPTPGEDTSSLRAVVSGGATLPPATAAACRCRFGCPIVDVHEPRRYQEVG